MGAAEDDRGHALVDHHIHAITLGASSGSIFLSPKIPRAVQNWEILVSHWVFLVLVTERLHFLP